MRINKVNVLSLLVLLLLCACSSEQLEGTVDDGSVDDVAIVEAIDVSNVQGTRALNLTLNSFSLSVLNTKTNALLVDKLQFTTGASGFTSANTWRMGKNEMKAIAVSPTMDDCSAVVLDNDNQYFDYTIPNEVPEGTMYKIGANLSFTQKSTGGKLSLKFVNALSLLTMRVRNEMKVEREEGNETKEYSVKIFVKKVIIHNLYSKGRFNFTGDLSGTWTPIDEEYANYSQELATAVELSTTQFTDVLNSALVLMPQAPQDRAWAPAAVDTDPSEAYAEANGIAKANADHKVYISLYCSMTADFGDGDVYLWGGQDDYVPVYFPYIKKYCPKSWNTINKQGVYNMKFIKEEALDADGRPIKPQAQTGANESFENAEFISVSPTDTNDNDWVDDWEDPTNVDVVFN